MAGESNNLFMIVSSFQDVTLGDPKNTISGAFFDGEYYAGSKCWIGFGFSENTQFDAQGALPNQVITSGTILVTWIEQCSGSNAEFTETITFSGVLTATRNSAEHTWGTTHRQDFDRSYSYKQTVHFDNMVAKAVVSNLSISSPAFGTAIRSDQTWSFVGQSRYHNVEITRF